MTDLVKVAAYKVPLSRGGTNDIANILPSCRPCNVKKHTRTAVEFIAVLFQNKPIWAEGR